MNNKYLDLDNKQDLLTPNLDRFTSPAFDIDKYNKLQKSFKDNYLQTWAKLAREKLSFKKDFSIILDDSNKPNYKWFSDGGINVAYNCVEQHAQNTPNSIALICESDNGDSSSITYKQLNDEVNQCANMLKDDFGVQKGDRVVLYLPMIKESIVSMLACNKIGAIHSIVFGGFSANALRDRIQDTKAKLNYHHNNNKHEIRSQKKKQGMTFGKPSQYFGCTLKHGSTDLQRDTQVHGYT